MAWLDTLRALSEVFERGNGVVDGVGKLLEAHIVEGPFVDIAKALGTKVLQPLVEAAGRLCERALAWQFPSVFPGFFGRPDGDPCSRSEAVERSEKLLAGAAAHLITVNEDARVDVDPRAVGPQRIGDLALTLRA
jgi:hypothetical protein